MKALRPDNGEQGRAAKKARRGRGAGSRQGASPRADSALRSLQRSLGNAQFARLMAEEASGSRPLPHVQSAAPARQAAERALLRSPRGGPGQSAQGQRLGGVRGRPALLGDDNQLTLDPELAARFGAIAWMQDALTPAGLRPNLLQIPDDAVAAPGPLDVPPPPQPKPLVPRGKGPATPKKAQTEDLIKAIMALPALDSAIDTLRARAVERVERDYHRLRIGERVAAVSALALIAGGGIAGGLSSPDARRFGLQQLNGRLLPVPGVRGLEVELNTQGDNVMVGLHLDVGRLLPTSFGFKASAGTPIGGPPAVHRATVEATAARGITNPEHTSALVARDVAFGSEQPGASTIQRRDPRSGTAVGMERPLQSGTAGDKPRAWRPPGGARLARTREEARESLVFGVIGPLDGLERELKRARQPAPESSRIVLERASAWMRALDGSGPLTFLEVEDLNAFSHDVEAAYRQSFAALKHLVHPHLEAMAHQPAPNTAAAEASLAKQSHAAFRRGDRDRIAEVNDSLDKVKTYSERVVELIAWARRGAFLIASSETYAQLNDQLGRVAGGASAVDDALGKVTSVAHAAHALMKLTGVRFHAGSEGLDMLRKFEAGIEAIDVGSSFFEAVPLLGSLWSNYLEPGTEVCIKLLGVIAAGVEEQNQQWAVVHDRVGVGAPGEGTPGGPPVRRYMLAIMRDRTPQPNAEVRRYFLENKELLNAGRESRAALKGESTSHWYDPRTWGDERLKTDLTRWVRMNRDAVWRMLYGDHKPWL